ncbi:MAG: protein kinase [Verrucomicrobiae bacterium]|nr:protein kinase [Verrucomicrobiae bacterium]
MTRQASDLPEGQPLPPLHLPESQPAPVIPDHVLLHLLGRGAYGEVWLGRNAVGTLRAVKVVRRATFKSERPYEREFSGMLKFEPVSRAHEGLMDILQVGRNDVAGYFYYVMELADDARQRIPELATTAAEREALHRRLTGVEEGGGPGAGVAKNYSPLTLGVERALRGRLPVSECLRHFAVLTNGLEALHGAGLVHRDIKPSNTIIVGGVAKLADIGLVADMDETRSFVGTEGFIPPEGPGTPQADIYSLGKVFYELATGRDRNEYPSLPEDMEGKIPPEDFFELNAIIARACASDREERYANARELRADLALLQGGRSVRRQRVAERNFRIAQKVGVAAMLLALVGVLAAVFFIQKARLERDNFQRSEQLRHQLQAALNDRELALGEEYRARAAAELLTDHAGHRAAALSAVTRAAKLGGAVVPVRSEAIAALALIDLEPGERSPAPALLKTVESALAPGFQHYATTATNGDIVLRRYPDGAELDRWHGEARAPQWLGPFSPDGRWFSYFSDSLEVVVRDAHAEILRVPNDPTWNGPADPGWWVARGFSPDSRVLAVARAQGVTLFELAGGGSRTIPLPWVASTLAFRPDGQVLLLGAKAATNQIAWVDLRDDSVRTLSLPVPTGVFSLAWSKDGRQFAAGAGDWNIYLFEANQPERLPAVLSGHQEVPIALAFHPDGQLLVSSSWDCTTRLWSLSRHQVVTQLPGWGWDIQFDADGRRFSCYDAISGALCTYRLTGQAVCRQMATPLNSLRQTAFAPDGTWLAAADGEAVHFFDTHNGHELGQITGLANGVVMLGSAATNGAAPGLVIMGADCQRWPLQRDPDGSWQIGPPTGLAPQTGRVLMDSAGGETFGLCADGKGITIYRPGQAPKLLDRSRAQQQPALSRDGTRAAVTRLMDAPRGPTLFVWNTQSGKVIWSTAVHDRGGVAFSPDGRELAATTDAGVTVWDLASSNVVWHATDCGGTVREDAIVWSPDGRLLAATHGRFATDLLAAATGELLARIEHPEPQLISSLGFSPDGTQLAVGCLSGRVQVWDLPELRRQLAALGLDWQQRAWPPSKEATPVKLHLIF